MWKRALLALIALAWIGPAVGLDLQSTTVPGRPVPSLSNGEIAINRADRTLFFKNVDDTIGRGALLNATPAGRAAVEQDDASALSITPSSGGVARQAKDLFSNEIYAVNYGVVQGAADNGPALRAAFKAAQDLSANLKLPPWDINVCVDPADAEGLLRVERLMGLEGASRASRILPCATAGNRAIILIKPKANTNIRGMVVRDLTLGPLGGRYFGGDAIRVDTTNTLGYVAKLLIDNIGTGTGGPGVYAFHHVNTLDANQTGGMFASTIRSSDLIGGTKFEKTGDSNNILENVIFNHNIGIDYEGIAGAATHRIEGNNITSFGGAIRLRNTIQAKIIRNQMEQAFAYTGDPSDNAMVTLDGTSFSTIEGNNANARGRVDVFNLKNGSSYNTIGPNTAAYTDSTFLLRATNAPNNTLQKQVADIRLDGAGGYRKLPLASVDTVSAPVVGLFQMLTLENGFTDAGGQFFNPGIQAGLQTNNTVRLSGSIANGTRTQGTRIASVPAAMRPNKAQYIPVFALTGAGGILVMDTAGQLIISSLPASGTITLDHVSYSLF